MSIPWEALLMLLGFLIIHLCGTVWWMSKIQTTLQILSTSVVSIQQAITKHEATYYSKEDAAKDLAYRDQQIAAIWKRLDKDENRS